jgi:hypothetical protein
MARDLERIGIASYRGRRVYFLASIAYYDALEDEIHRRFHHDEKTYLSAKGRKCSLKSAAEFSNRNDAVNHFDTWINRQANKHWKLDVIPCSEPQDVEFRLYDKTHPLFKVETELPRYALTYARAFYYDYLHELTYSKSTLLRIQKLLLPYGIDITTRVSDSENLGLKTKAMVDKYTLGNQTHTGLKLISDSTGFEI